MLKTVKDMIHGLRSFIHPKLHYFKYNPSIVKLNFHLNFGANKLCLIILV